MNELTIEEFDALSPDTYVLYDIRSTEEINHGAIRGAIASSAEELEENPPEEKEKKLIICCSRGRVSRDVAENLCEQGYDAVSLKGGYIAWLMAEIKKQEADEICDSVEKSLRKKFHKNIFSKFAKAINQYELVKEGDRIAVCISGGKDSMLMAKLFQELKKHNKFPFEVKFLVMDPGYSPENRQVIEENARKLKIPIQIFESDIFDAVYTIEKSPCYLCARMRRGHLYTFAKQLGCNNYNNLHFIQCACKFTDTCTTCNNEENLSKRVEVKELIRTLKAKNPFVESNIFKSVENVNLDTVVAYKQGGVRHHFLDTYDREPETAKPCCSDAADD